MKGVVIYWSGMGNTKMMAESIAEGMNQNYPTDLFFVSDFSGDITEYDKIAFGCPSMGAEQLEDIEFEPFFANVESKLAAKDVLLFGSYGWGNGEWMDEWQQRCIQQGMNIMKAHIVNETPTNEQLDECKEIGSSF